MSFCPDKKIPFIYARIMADIFSTNNVFKRREKHMWKEEYFNFLITKGNPFIELSDLIAKLKRNEQNCSKEILETKYKEAYTKLKIKIELCIKSLIMLNANTDAKFIVTDADKAKEMRENALDFMNNQEQMADIYRAAFNEYDHELVEIGAIEKADEIIKRYYMPYWFSHTFWDQEHGALYNEIIHRWRINGKWVRPYDHTVTSSQGEEYVVEKDQTSYSGLPASIEEMKTIA